MEVTFTNVTITIAGVKDARQAYDILCDSLSAIPSSAVVSGATCVEWETDRYYTDDDTLDGEVVLDHSTSDLFPTE